MEKGGKFIGEIRCPDCDGEALKVIVGLDEEFGQPTAALNCVACKGESFAGIGIEPGSYAMLLEAFLEDEKSTAS